MKANLTRHLRYGCGQGPRFMCPYCQMRSKDMSNLYRHIRAKHRGMCVFLTDVITGKQCYARKKNWADERIWSFRQVRISRSVVYRVFFASVLTCWRKILVKSSVSSPSFGLGCQEKSKLRVQPGVAVHVSLLLSTLQKGHRGLSSCEILPQELQSLRDRCANESVHQVNQIEILNIKVRLWDVFYVFSLKWDKKSEIYLAIRSLCGEKKN